MSVERDLTELVRVSEETGALIEITRIRRVVEELPEPICAQGRVFRQRVLAAITPVATVAEPPDNSRRGLVPDPEAGSDGSSTAAVARSTAVLSQHRATG